MTTDKDIEKAREIVEGAKAGDSYTVYDILCYRIENALFEERQRVLDLALPVLEEMILPLKGIYPEMSVRTGLTMAVTRLVENEKHALALLEKLRGLG